MPTDSSNPSNYSSLSKNYRTTWKGRLFYPTGNEQDRQTSTNSNTEDVNEWSSQESDVDAYNPVATDRTEHRATIHNSSPLAQTILPSYREDITIDLAALMSPIDDAQFGLDSFGPFNITPKNKAGESTSVQATPTTAQSMLDILSATNAEDTSQCHQREQYDIYCNMDGKPEQKAGTEQGNISNSLESDVHDSTASPCERLESDLNTFESRTWTKGKDDSEQRTIWRRHIRASSTSSDSSTSSTSSTESFSSDSSDSSQTSPISGVSFFSSPPKTFAAATIESSTSSETALSTNTIKVPSSMMTMLPASNRREKETSYSFSTTSPVAPPSENPGSERTDTGFTRPSLPATGTTHANPKALMLKRMAYIHTLKKLRERERRPFQHAVLLQLVLLQLRQGITNNQCEEIGDFYTSMWTAHFPAKWGVSSLTAPGQCQSYVQQTLLQGLQRGQSENGLNQAKTTAPQSSKDAKTKRSFISSIQSRIQFSKASNGASVSSSVSSNVMEPVSDSGATSTSPAYYLSPPLASSCVNRANSTAFKDRFPLLRTPPYPLINLDEKDPFPLAPASHRTVSATTVSGGAPSICVGYGVDKDGQADLDQHEAVRPSPTIIIPKLYEGTGSAPGYTGGWFLDIPSIYGDSCDRF
ncbi:hypothetical protein BGZ54_007482 [Gamsiella multidivaricata]|nr:hypothetical protein BGZ54_007482 [Gamsiella multidivaricata]